MTIINVVSLYGEKMQYVSNSGCVSIVPAPNVPLEGKTLT